MTETSERVVAMDREYLKPLDIHPVLFDVGEPVPVPVPVEISEPQKVVIPDPTEPMQFEPPLAGAIISPCGLFRYTLWRRFKEERPGEKHLLFCMANPSKADALQDDQTVGRVIYFAKREDAAIVTVVNFAAFRATKPKDMRAAADPFGPDNMRHIAECGLKADAIILAWGNLGGFKHAGRRLYRDIKDSALGRKPILCFGKTKLGHPRHALFLRSDTKLVPFAYGEPTEEEFDSIEEDF